MWAATRRAAALALLSFVPAALALFEDEVGQYDWVLQQIGKPTSLAYSADASDRIFVASASGVVASVLLKDGTMQWRRAASTQGRLRLLRAGSKGLISVTDQGFVQAWKSSSGDLTWQREYQDAVVDLLLAGSGQKQIVVVLRESEVEARTMAGKHEWSVPSPSGAKAPFRAIATGDESTLCAIAAGAGGAGASAVQLETATGKVVKKSEVPPAVAKGLQGQSFVVVDSYLVFLTGDTISAYSLCDAGKEAGTFQLSKVKSKGRGAFRLMPWQRTAGVFAATNGETTAIFGLGPKGLKHLRTFDGVAVVGPVFSVHDDETAQPVAVAIVKEEGTQIQLLDPASGNVQPAINAPGYTSGDHGAAQLLLLHELGSGEHRTVISGADHSLAGIQGTKVAWVREEGLASIQHANFYSRSAAVIAAQRADRSNTTQGLPALGAQLSELPAVFGRLVSDPLELVSSLFSLVTPKRSGRSASMSGVLHAKMPSHAEELRDFGADKLILAVSRSSKLYALEATTSEIVWHRYLGEGGMDCNAALPAGSGEIGPCSPWMQLLPSSSAAYSELLVITAAPAKSDSTKLQHQLLWLDPLTGKVLHQETMSPGISIQSVMPLPRKGSPTHTVLPFLLIDGDHKVHTMPSPTPELTQFVDDNAEKLFHYEVDTSAQVVQGFMINTENKANDLVRLWNLELASVGERILSSAFPQHREWDHVPVHIKGDASILYKYINANLLAVVSEDVRGNSSSLNLYALDAVTGHVLHQSHIPGGAKPVHLVVCDNWVIMHYRNPKKTRFELVVMEFFQAKADDGPWDILFGGRGAGNTSKSAHHLETPVPLQQTYIFPAGVTAMGVTATLKGITPRSIIMGLTTEHVFHVSKDILNPRRPYQSASGVVEKDKISMPAQFAPTKEEALPPYSPLIPLKPTDVLTHSNSVGQVAGIISSPTALESTSLVFTYGLDLFFVPVQTAKAYDVLSPGFNYLLLYASLGIVVVVFVITSFVAQRKALQERWK